MRTITSPVARIRMNWTTLDKDATIFLSQYFHLQNWLVREFLWKQGKRNRKKRLPLYSTGQNFECHCHYDHHKPPNWMTNKILVPFFLFWVRRSSDVKNVQVGGLLWKGTPRLVSSPVSTLQTIYPKEHAKKKATNSHLKSSTFQGLSHGCWVAIQGS